MPTAKKTRDHAKIKHWVEQRGGRPAILKDTKHDGGCDNVLRIKFDESEEDLVEVQWRDFFEIFEQQGLAFAYDDDGDGEERLAHGSHVFH